MHTAARGWARGRGWRGWGSATCQDAMHVREHPPHPLSRTAAPPSDQVLPCTGHASLMCPVSVPVCTLLPFGLHASCRHPTSVLHLGTAHGAARHAREQGLQWQQPQPGWHAY